jgi:hypothetical protein
MPVDARAKAVGAAQRGAPREDVEPAVEAARRILAAAVGILQVEPDEAGLRARVEQVEHLREPVLVEARVGVHDQHVVAPARGHPEVHAGAEAAIARRAQQPTPPGSSPRKRAYESSGDAFSTTTMSPACATRNAIKDATHRSVRPGVP